MLRTKYYMLVTNYGILTTTYKILTTNYLVLPRPPCPQLITKRKSHLYFLLTTPKQSTPPSPSPNHTEWCHCGGETRHFRWRRTLLEFGGNACHRLEGYQPFYIPRFCILGLNDWKQVSWTIGINSTAHSQWYIWSWVIILLTSNK